MATKTEKIEAGQNARGFTLKPVSPYDFDLSATIFSDGDPQFRAYEGGRFWQVLQINGKLALGTVHATGTVEEPTLHVELQATQDLSLADVRQARRLINRIFNLDMDLKPFYEATAGDPVMARLSGELFGLKSPTTPTVFEALVDSIVEQQISLIAAHSMQRRLIRGFGDSVTLAGRTYYAFPGPAKLSSATVSALKDCGLSGRKAEYIRDISGMIKGGGLDLDKFQSYQDINQIREELKSIRGIGDWTAEMTMIRGLQKMDSIPADDLGLQARISYFYGKDRRVTSAELKEIAEKWGNWRGLGSYYMIVAHLLNIETGKGPQL